MIFKSKTCCFILFLTSQTIIIHRISFSFNNLPQSMSYQMQLWHKLDPLCPEINQHYSLTNIH